MTRLKRTRQADSADPRSDPLTPPAADDAAALLRGDVVPEDVPEARKTERPVVVGIGASAGGLQALSTFFEVMPPDTGMTFVVVTHLAPDHESVLDELLQRRTKMPVTQVLADEVAIAPNHVFVIPPGRRLVLADTHLYTGEYEGSGQARAPIDIFFRSLAAVHVEPIAVVLTGGGSDGALGVRSIKEASGLVLVQDPEEAAFESMPRAAIATGMVDVVLPIRELARKLVEVNRRRVHVPSDPTRLTAEQEDALERILTQLFSRSGHDFRAYKQTTVLRRIQRRMQLNGYETLDGYLQYLQQDANEAQALLADLLIGVTNFFRDQASWSELETTIVPELFRRVAADEVVRVWSIGCSTGEEAYSLAILLLEHAATLDIPPRIQVFATDLDEAALSKAREGFYPDTIAADVSPERLERFFTREGAYYHVRREVRDVVLFASHSVLRDPPFSRQDLIVCRNLLIYLQRPLQDNLFEVFYYALQPKGYLFLGSSESADGATDLFLTVDKKHRIFQAREWTGQQPALPNLPIPGGLPRRPAAGPRPETRPLPAASAADRSLYEHMLEEYGPPTILVDDEANIVRLSGTAGRYLEHPDGPPTNNLFRLIRPELQFELRSGLFQAFERGLASVSPPVLLSIGAAEHRVFISVRPRAEPGEQRLALVVLVEDESYRTRSREETGEDDGDTGVATEQLQAEVGHLRARLQSTVEEYETSNEELKAANEELQSINEEYRSMTEELETSKEELQSVNEELATVNNELKNKLDEISRTNSDLQNLMAATEIATLFLDRDLRVRGFSDRTEDIFNILRSDRGRPIEHLTHRLVYPELIEDARQVLRTLAALEREVRRVDGDAWYLARLRPYRTVDDRIEGIVLSFVEISGLKRTEEALRRSNRLLELALGAARMGWVTWDMGSDQAGSDGRIRAILGYPDDGLPVTIERWFERIHPDDRDRVEAAVQDALNRDERLDIEYRVIRPDGEGRVVQTTGLFITDEPGSAPRWTGLMRDVTEDRRLRQGLAETRAWLAQALESADLGWGMVNVETGELEQDARARALAGFTADEPLTIDQWMARIHPDDIGWVQADMEEAIRDGRNTDVEYRIVLPDGEERLIHGTGALRTRPNGDRIITGTVRDVTERRRDEAALRRLTEDLEARVAERTEELQRAYVMLSAAHERFRTLFHANPVPTVLYRPSDGVALDTNDAFLQYNGVTRDQVVGRRADALRGLFDVDTSLDLVEASTAKGSLHSIEHEFRHPSGEMRSLIVSVEPIELDGELCLLGTHVDVTELKDAQRLLQERGDELERANAELSDARDRFFAIFRANPVASLIFDFDDWVYMDANPAMVALSGLSREEIVGRPPETFAKFGDPEREAELAAIVAREGGVRDFETTFGLDPDHRRVVLASVEPVILNGHNCQVTTLVDITDRKEAERRIREQSAALEAANAEIGAARDRFRTLFNANPVSSIIYRQADWRIIDANQTFAERAGLRREDLQGTDGTAVAFALDGEEQERLYTALEEHGRLSSFELTYHSKSGEAFTALASFEPLELDGEATWLATYIDITDRKRSEERILEQSRALEAMNRDLTLARDRFQTLFNASPVSGAIYRPSDDTILDVNEAFLERIPISRDEIVGREVRGLSYLLDSEELARTVEALRARGRLRNFELTYGLPSGERRDALVSIEPIELDNERCLLAKFIDITDRKRAEQQVRDLASELSRAEQQERQRISTVLHDDLQQRLYALQIELVQLRHRLAQDDTGAALLSVDKMDALVPPTINVARGLSVDLSPPILHDEGLAEAIGWVAARMRQQYDLEVKVTAEESFPLHDEGLRIILFQVVRELLFNVVKHADSPNVVVELSREGEQLRIDVRDHGRGFDPDVVLADRGAPSTGRGLSMARRRLELFGGQLDVQSAPGAGVQVVIRVPLAPLTQLSN